MNFIKKIFDKKEDNLVHLQFQKFSKGEFKNKAVIQAKNSSGKFTIFTTYEFANELVRDIAEKLGNNRTNVTGAVISTSDLTGEIDFSTKKQFMGVKQYGINKEMSGNEIVALLNKFPKVFFALSFKTNDSELKIKAKAPKSAKPNTKEEQPKPDFCKLITNDKKLASEFIFEGEFKKASINHTFLIKDIIFPKEAGEDFALIREMAKRKGKIIRESNIDDKITKREIDFVA